MMAGGKCSVNTAGRLILLVVALLSVVPDAQALKITKVEVPPWVRVGENATLECHVDLEDDSLYSLTWWRGQSQFYQFSPTNVKNKSKYDLPGIRVDEASSSLSVVMLVNVSLETGGRFKCEVVADFPTFEKDTNAKDMEVIDVPDRVPLVMTSSRVYSRGDLLVANCTSPLAKPQPVLEWLVNGQKVPSKYSHIVSQGLDPHLGLLSPTSELRLTLSDQHFDKGQITLSCLSTISTIYHEMSELVLYSPDRKHVAPSQKLYGTGTVVGANLVMVGVTCVVTVFLLVM